MVEYGYVPVWAPQCYPATSSQRLLAVGVERWSYRRNLLGGRGVAVLAAVGGRFSGWGLV
ncbi:MAG TPA: hypothetical protein VGO77_02470 [Mycobacterium sp.]|nr:hypothetical protein [Mycobacterium sp.]